MFSVDIINWNGLVKFFLTHFYFALSLSRPSKRFDCLLKMNTRHLISQFNSMEYFFYFLFSFKMISMKSCVLKHFKWGGEEDVFI